MARSGGFGGSLNPFGSGSLGSLSQYDIASDLADLEVYKVEVAWGNGLASDEDYLAALTKAVNATDPGTQKRESAVNKFDDATYRIDRSKAEALGLDQLIAFDTAALAKMNPSNVRYRDVQDSLQSEQASRRSRDYGKLVQAYNDGKSTTKSLLTWVNAQLATLTADDPDFANWTQVKGDLGDRIVSENDSKVYQDYQQGRMKAPAFLAYITSRRNDYQPGTPQFDEWSRKLEDAQKQAADTAQSAKDSAFFNKYQEGKVSDATYLKYLSDRIKGMKPDDPSLGDWKHRLVQATFSLAEDKLRLQVSEGHAPVSRLVSFYKTYQRTLNPGSAEWRSVQRNLDSLHASGSSGGGGSSGGASKGTTQTGAGSAIGPGPALTSAGKAINPKYSLDNILGLFSIDPSANKHAIATAKSYLDKNKQSIYNALQDGDKVWLFSDPRNPNATVAELDPQGNPTGRRIRGSAYLPVQSEAYSNILLVEAGNWNAAGELALALHKYNDAAKYQKRAAEAFDNARKNDAGYRTQNTEDYTTNMLGVADQATKAGDYGLALHAYYQAGLLVEQQLKNPYLTAETRAKLDGLATKIAANPLFDPNTNQARALNVPALANGEVVLNPGWHHTLDTTSTGQQDWGPKFSLDPAWDAKHVTVATSFGDRVVKGDVAKSPSGAPINPDTVIQTTNGPKKLTGAFGGDFISYVDERGQVVRAYSLDGQTWISSAAGMPAPTMEVNPAAGPLQASADGTSYFLAGQPDKIVFAQNDNGVWAATADGMSVVGWYGQARYEADKAQYKSIGGTTASGERRDFATQAGKNAYLADLDMGGPGMHMTLATVTPEYRDNQGNLIDSGLQGVVNLVSPSFYRTDYGSHPSFSLKEREQMTVAERAAVTDPNGDLFGRIKSGATQLPGVKTHTGKAADDLARTVMPVTQAQLAAQLPPNDRYDGYELNRGVHVVPPPIPKLKPVTGSALKGVPTKKSTPPPVKKATTATIAGKSADDKALALSKKPAAKALPKPPALKPLTQSQSLNLAR